MRKRLDEMLKEHGLVASRSQANDLVKRGHVYVDGNLACKSGSKISSGARLSVAPEAEAQYVSRSALKLKHALQKFQFDPKGLDVLDAGASTGGFTEVLLEQGATRVFAVDVGHGQLHQKLRKNSRVISLEKQDVRNLTLSMFPTSFKGITIDLSFISLVKVLPFLFDLASEKCWLVALIKPQFEVGKKAIGKGGIVKNKTAVTDAIKIVEDQFNQLHGWFVKDIIPSPLRGGSGNEEYLIGAYRNV